jgi:Amt family ammonium transporter
MGVGAFAVLSIVASTIVWLLLNYRIGLRPTHEEELLGLDKAEIGLEAYPEFQK